MAKNKVKKLGELLLEFNYITEDQLKDVINKQGNSKKKLGELLVEMGYLSENDLVEVLEFQLGIPHADLSKYVLNPQLAKYVPENLARRYDAIPIEVRNNFLKLGMKNPLDLVAIDDIEMTSNLKIEPMIVSKREIRQAIGQIYSVGEEDAAEVFASLKEVSATEEPELDELKRMIEDAPIVRLANIIISQAIQLRASDINIEPQDNIVRIRYRIDGVLIEKMTAPKHTQAALISRIKIIADIDITKRRIPQDGRVEMNVKGIKVDMRVSTLPTIHGEKVVIRLLNKDESLLDIEKLGFNTRNLKYFKNLIKKPYGILLVTGPTGSRKSTTLFAALNRLNTADKNIITIEDPVEYQINGVNQVQANPEIGLTFAETLRSILRQDPDIIMVGEIRDEETANIAVRSALTGHLVLSTLHTNDSVSSITRLVDMGIPPYLVASTLIGVIAQRLVRKLCDDCKILYEPGIEEQKFFDIDKRQELFNPGSCEKCGSTGYKGRLAVQEVLLIDKTIENMITTGESEQVIKEYALKNIMTGLKEDGKMKVIDGFTTYNEIARVIV